MGEPAGTALFVLLHAFLNVPSHMFGVLMSARLSSFFCLFAALPLAFACTDVAPLEAKIAATTKAYDEAKKELGQCKAKVTKLSDSVKKKIRLETENARLRAQVESLRADRKANKSGDEELISKTADILGISPDQKIFATIVTSKGRMVAELYWKRAPLTVTNFVQLAEGTKEWTDPRDGKRKKGVRLYDDTIFHRVIPEFMIQAGDPLGTGAGGPGYQFKDEFHPSLRHGEAGILSMANAGRNTNGSQFFITEVATPMLDKKHSVFGKVIDNLPLIGKIARVKKSNTNAERPDPDVKLHRIRIGRGKPWR